MAKKAIAKSGKESRGKREPTPEGIRLKRRLSRLRKLIVGGRIYPKLFSQPPHSSSVTGIVLRGFHRWHFLPQAQEVMEDSIQYELMRFFREEGCSEIDQDYEEAKAVARGVLFDCTLRLSVLHRKDTPGTPVDAINRTVLLNDPYRIISDEILAAWLADGMAGGGAEFLRSLANDFYNAERREQRVPTDWNALVLARHWTDSDYPLWLMQRGAILHACKGVSTNGTWTAAYVENRLKKLRLVRKHRPIVGVVLNAAKCITAYEVSKATFSKLRRTQFDWCSPPCDAQTPRVPDGVPPGGWMTLYDRLPQHGTERAPPAAVFRYEAKATMRTRFR